MIRLTSFALAAGVALAAVAAQPGAAEAKRAHFSFYAPGIGIHIGSRNRHHRRHHSRRHYRKHHSRRHHRRRHYRPYIYYAPPVRYYAPRRRHYGRCDRLANRCARNWGWHNSNWRGCMRYYGCR